jgi:hypothetical protein
MYWLVYCYAIDLIQKLARNPKVSLTGSTTGILKSSDWIIIRG